MAEEYDSALAVRGNVLDGDTIYPENTILISGGSDGTNYKQISVDSSGRQLVVGPADDGSAVVGSPVLTAGKYEATPDSVDDGDVVTLSLDSYGRTIVVGQVADGSAIDATAYPVLIAGQDGTNVQALKTDSTGRLAVVVGGGVKDGIDYASANLVKDTPTTVISKAGACVVTRIMVSGSALMKVDVKYGTTLSETTKFVKYNSPANPNVEFIFPNGLEIGTDETILVECTNLENRASPASDFTAHATIFTEVTV